MQSIYRRSRQVFWLNPASRSARGTGASERYRCRNACTRTIECRKLRQPTLIAGRLPRSIR